MRREETELLKERYYAATATPEEERRLEALLRSGECPEDWAGERRALLAMMAAGAQGLPEGFGARLTARLERERKAGRKARTLRLVWRSVAAVVAVMLGGWAVRLAVQQPAEGPELVAKAEPEVLPAAVPAVKAEPEAPRAEMKETPAAPAKTMRKPRRKKAAPAVAPEAATAGKMLAAETAEPTPPEPQPAAEAPAPVPSPRNERSLAAQLERTLQSRDRLMAEARAYMAGNCLDRRMPPIEPETTQH